MTAYPVCEVRKVFVQEIADAPNLQALLDAYADESKNKDLPPHRPDMAAYAQMERVGLMHTFGAFCGVDLVGFLTVLVTVMPHYNARMATCESFFVADGYRKGGTAKKLLDAVESFAKSDGVTAFFVSAPVGGRLADAMPMLGYRETNRTFFRSL